MIPDCTLTTSCFDLTIFHKQSRSLNETINNMKQLLEVPCYLVIYADSNCMSQIKEIRNLFGLNNITRYVEIEFTELPKYKYIDDIKMNREKYWPTKDERTCSENHILQVSKVDFVLKTIQENPFNTSKFGWIDSNLGLNFSKISINYKDNMLIDILNNCPDKFHLQVLNVCDKKYKEPINKKEMYEKYRWIVCGSFYTMGVDIGKKIISRLNELFIEITNHGYGHGDELIFLEILDEFYDDIERSYGDYKHILNNYIITTEGLDYIYHFIIKNYLNFGYYRECYDCCMKIIKDMENNKNNIINYSLYVEILFSLYIASYYYKNTETLSIVNYMYELYNNNNLFKIEFDKNKHFYESQFKFSNCFKPKYKLVINIFACATVEKYKNEILKINETWGKVAEELGIKVLFFLGEEQTDLKDDTKYIYLKGVNNDYNSASYKQNLGLKYIYENYCADFIFTCGTDTYINIQKILLYIDTFDKNKNLYIGGHGDYRFVNNKNTYYHSGCGFFITNNILSLLYSKLYKVQDEWTEICKNSNVDYLIPYCDVLIGYYLSMIDVETIKSDYFFSCNYNGLANNNTFNCCQNKIKLNEIICCHNMNLSEFDEYTEILEKNNYFID